MLQRIDTSSRFQIIRRAIPSFRSYIGPKIHLANIIIDALERSQLYMDLTAMLAAILAVILDSENIFRFVELLLKNKVVLKKY